MLTNQYILSFYVILTDQVKTPQMLLTVTQTCFSCSDFSFRLIAVSIIFFHSSGPSSQYCDAASPGWPGVDCRLGESPVLVKSTQNTPNQSSYFLAQQKAAGMRVPPRGNLAMPENFHERLKALVLYEMRWDILTVIRRRNHVHTSCNRRKTSTFLV